MMAPIWTLNLSFFAELQPELVQKQIWNKIAQFGVCQTSTGKRFAVIF